MSHLHDAMSLFPDTHSPTQVGHTRAGLPYGRAELACLMGDLSDDGPA